MENKRKCSKCQKELVSGKFYNFYSGKKGGIFLGTYRERKIFCSSCAEKEKENDILFRENLIKISWEVGNKLDEAILDFEQKWINFQYENSVRINNEETNLTLDFIQKSKQIFQPYLKRLDVVEKSFGGKIEGRGKPEMKFDYLFTKSALDRNYCKAVVKPTIAEVLGGNPNQEINTTNVGASPGVPGRTAGIWQVDDKLKINYSWNDGPKRICRRISLLFYDQKLALQSLCRALTIKEKELGGDNLPPEPNTKICATCNKDISNQETTFNRDKDSEHEKRYFCSAECLTKSYHKKSPNTSNQNQNKGMSTGLKVFLGIGITLIILGGIVFFWMKIIKKRVN